MHSKNSGFKEEIKRNYDCSLFSESTPDPAPAPAVAPAPAPAPASAPTAAPANPDQAGPEG